MANVTSTGTVVGNSIAENAGGHIIREKTITYTDIVNAGTYADNDTFTFPIPVYAGETVLGVSVKLITAFNDSGGGDELDIEVGDGTDPNGFITLAPLHTDQTEISHITTDNGTYSGAYLFDGTTDNTVNGKFYASDDTIDCLFTPNASTGTDYSLDELTAGEVKIKVFFRDYN